MKHLRKITALVLTVMLVVGGMASALADASNYIDAPIANHDVTLTIYTYSADKVRNTYTDYNEVWLVKVLSDITGLNFEWMQPPAGDDGTFFNTTLASGIYPDLWNTGWGSYAGGIPGAIEDGILLDISKLAFEKCPNFVAKYNSLDDATKRLFWSDDGYLIGFGARLQGDVIRGVVHQGNYIREDKLKDYGLDVPMTIAQYEEVLEAFKNDPEIQEPLALPNVADNLWKNFSPFASAFGVAHGSFQRVADDSNVVQYSRAMPEYKEYLSLLNSWYKKGYFTSDFANRNNLECEELFKAGKAGLAFFGNWKLKSANKVLQMVDEDAFAVGAYYMRKTEDQKIHLTQQMTDVINQSPWMISADCKNVDAALAFIDFLYRDGNNVLTTWGPTLEEYAIWPLQAYDENAGKIVPATEDQAIYYLNENGERRQTEWFQNVATFFDPIPNNFTIEWETDKQNAQYDDTNKQAWERFGYNSDQNWLIENFVTMTAEENLEYTEIMNTITTYSNECIAKMIVGDMAIEDFDNMVAEMKAMGLDRATEIIQEAYNRYQARSL